MKSATQTRPRRSSSVIPRPERSVGVTGAPRPWPRGCSGGGAPGGGATRRTRHAVAAAASSTARPSPAAITSFETRRVAIGSERPVDKRVVDAREEQDPGGAHPYWPLEPAHAARDHV